MQKKLIFAKSIDSITLEMKPDWPLEECQRVARDIAEKHKVPVQFTFQDILQSIDPIPIQEPLPGI